MVPSPCEDGAIVIFDCNVILRSLFLVTDNVVVVVLPAIAVEVVVMVVPFHKIGRGFRPLVAEERERGKTWCACGRAFRWGNDGDCRTVRTTHFFGGAKLSGKAR